MIFLLTNDDGFDSEKINYTKQVLQKLGTVYTVAPRTEQSAKSMSLSIGGFNFEKVDEFNYKIDGTPVDYYNVNYVLRGMEIPKGSHTVVFKFDPTVVKTGSTIALISTILVMVLMLVLTILNSKKPS